MESFDKAIEMGLAKSTHEKSSVKCYPTYVTDLPTGKENGKFLALDLGGTNFRVLVITLSPKRFDMKSKIYAVPSNVMTGPGPELFDHIAVCLFKFCKEYRLLNDNLPLGFTFSFPLIQKGLTQGILVRWTKGFNCSDSVGKNVVQMLVDAINRRGDMKIDVLAVLNDTTGTLMSCAWKNTNTRIGLIIGTGTNCCYTEKVSKVELFDGDRSKEYVIVNTESGAFGDDGSLDSVRNDWDKQVDSASVNPGMQLHEKMISGMYMGELVRLVIVDAAKKNLVFGGATSEKMNTRNSFLSKYVSDIESDKRGTYNNMKKIMKEMGHPNAGDQDLAIVRFICEAISSRAGKMLSATMAVLLNRIGLDNVTIGVDGSLFRFHPGFKDLMNTKIRELTKYTFNLMLSEDGSGRGAALVAAVAARELEQKKT
ncbi:hexokinase type 2 [Anabrus simplex]|uniref:hexokinase type 2 n=1 Tax=Anabrus simplex TaxID=316456 RepID=UPI0035A36C9C